MSGTSNPNAPAASSIAEKKNSLQFVGFQIEDQDYAFRIEQIREIVMLPRVTRTPQVPGYVEGVSNLRGTIIPIINLRKLLGLSPKAADADTRTIVVSVGERTMGCTVDLVSQVMRIPMEDIQPAPDTILGDASEYVTGFAKLDGRLMILLDIDKLLDPQQLEQRGNAGPPEAQAE